MNAPLLKPNWPKGPKICATENLPAFETANDLAAFLAKNAPSCKVVSKWECAACGHWHAYTVAPDPAGGSSGTGRGSKQSGLEEWKAFLKAETVGELVADQNFSK